VAAGQIRIIGGSWRGRKLIVPDLPDLRPTPDRVKETLFNWLQPVIEGLHGLDLFAGSGALGFEALSRGAASMVFVDKAAAAVTILQNQATALGANNAEIYQAKVPAQLKPPKHLFQLVFLDPPYQEDLLLPSCAYLEENGFLAPLAYIYLEANTMLVEQQLPAHWRILKSKKAGQVFYHLVQRKA
jgi:16S rRNA (guanine966-N2)-methyltransferase